MLRQVRASPFRPCMLLVGQFRTSRGQHRHRSDHWMLFSCSTVAEIIEHAFEDAENGIWYGKGVAVSVVSFVGMPTRVTIHYSALASSSEKVTGEGL